MYFKPPLRLRLRLGRLPMRPCPGLQNRLDSRVAENIQDSPCLVAFAVGEHRQGVLHRLHAEVFCGFGRPGAVDPVEESGDVDHLGTMLEEGLIDDLSPSQRTGVPLVTHRGLPCKTSVLQTE